MERERDRERYKACEPRSVSRLGVRGPHGLLAGLAGHGLHADLLLLPLLDVYCRTGWGNGFDKMPNGGDSNDLCRIPVSCSNCLKLVRRKGVRSCAYYLRRLGVVPARLVARPLSARTNALLPPAVFACLPSSTYVPPSPPALIDSLPSLSSLTSGFVLSSAGSIFNIGTCNMCLAAGYHSIACTCYNAGTLFMLDSLACFSRHVVSGSCLASAY